MVYRLKWESFIQKLKSVKLTRAHIFEILFFAITLSVYFWSFFNFWDDVLGPLWRPPPENVLDFFNHPFFMITLVGLVVFEVVLYFSIPKEARQFVWLNFWPLDSRYRYGGKKENQNVRKRG